MIKPHSFTRTTLDKIGDMTIHSGIYVLAYMGKIIYVGKAEEGIAHRIASHSYNALYELLGSWMTRNTDHENIRLDVLETPVGVDAPLWLRQVESKLIKIFNPLFNTNY